MKPLKALLIALLSLQILSGGLLVIAALPKSIILVLLCLLITVLQCVLTLAVIFHDNKLEHTWSEIERLRLAVRKLQNLAEAEEEMVYLTETPGELAKNTWECVKCGTVNKSETTRCSNCSAAYDAAVYPTDDPSVKRKMSRWVKGDKKRRSN